MELSVIILNWNAKEWLERCIGSVLAQETGGREFEVWLVDNASTDGSAEFASERFPGIRIERIPQNLGFAAGNNAAIPRAAGKNVLLLNPDTETHAGALGALLDFLEAHPKCGVVGPKLLNADGSLQYSCRRYPSLEAGLFRNTPLGKLFPQNKATRDYLMKDVSHDEPMQVDWVSGAAMLVRREVFDQIGLLDEAFFMYVEDVDFCRRAHDAGWEVWYEPNAVITHAIAASSDKNPLPMIATFHKSLYRYFRKHHIGKDYPKAIAPVVAAGLVARAFGIVGMGLWKRLRGKGPRENG
jgi:GT2 family glycosyltransferase